MAIFGNVTLLVQHPESPGTMILFQARPSTPADTALNYFFAILFILYFLCGILVSPLTTLFSFRQSASPSNSLLSLVSLLDHIKLVYFPLVLVPKLLAPQDEMDTYYYFKIKTSDIDNGPIGWVPHVNTVLLAVTGIEVFVVVMMCVARYTSVKYSSLPTPLLYLVSYVLVIFVLVMSFVPIFLFDHEPLIKCRITQDILTLDGQFNENVYKPAMKCKTIVLVIFFVLGLVSGVLMTIRLVKNRDCSDRQFQLCTCLMNLWNIVVILILVSYLFVASKRSKANPPQFSTGHDFFIFTATYGFPLTQSVINTICIARMKAFREEMLLKMKVTPQEIDTPSSAI